MQKFVNIQLFFSKPNFFAEKIVDILEIKKSITFASEKYPVVTERLREKCVAHKCRLRRTIFLPFWFVTNPLYDI